VGSIHPDESLVTYTLFGFWATACYAIADTQANGSHNKDRILVAGEEDRKMQAGFVLWVSDHLGVGLTILGAAAKLPVAFTVFHVLLGMPGDNVCSVL
jgi:hypothetical protein